MREYILDTDPSNVKFVEELLHKKYISKLIWTLIWNSETFYKEIKKQFETVY